MRQSTPVHIVVTDLTRMGGDRVCVAGVDPDGFTWRPEPGSAAGVRRADLKMDDGVNVGPGSVVEFFGEPKVDKTPPHIEDFVYRRRMNVVRHANDSEWLRALVCTTFPSVSDIFDGFIRNGRFVPPGSETRSLGTIIPISSSIELRIEDPEKPALRLSFRDQSEARYVRWAVNDLALATYVTERCAAGNSHQAIESEINGRISRIPELYLRVGLTRPWSATGPEQCWAQITAIHSSKVPRPG